MKTLKRTNNKLDTKKIILPFAKFSGITSFSSLRPFKNLLGIGRIGHSGVLDSFADGLMIALLGKGTKLSSYFTNCDKKYLAFCVFGTETDTLDYLGKTVSKKPLPELEKFLKILPSFEGTIMQCPPVYSRVHIKGVRAYKLAKAGKPVKPSSRKITIYSIKLLDYALEKNTSKVKTATLEIHCSKGTYIRALCRDIAAACGSSAYVSALRRTESAGFDLADCLWANKLPPFAKTCFLRETRLKQDSTKKMMGCFNEAFEKSAKNLSFEQFESAVLEFSPQLATNLGIKTLNLKPEFLQNFKQGKQIQKNWFDFLNKLDFAFQAAVFCNEKFCGIINFDKKNFSYKFVF